MTAYQSLDPNPFSVQAYESPNAAIFDFQYEPKILNEDFFTKQGMTLPPKLQQAIDKRRIEYLAGRFCASRALGKLGMEEPVTIPTGQNRAPIWPEGQLGSITHTKGYAAAIVGLEDHWFGLGIDAEMIVEESKPALIQHISYQDEFDHIHFTDDVPEENELFTLTFSAKESLFKALYPTVKSYFGFHSACIQQISMKNQEYAICLTRDLHSTLPRKRCFLGRFIRTQDKIITLMMIPSDPEPMNA